MASANAWYEDSELVATTWSPQVNKQIKWCSFTSEIKQSTKKLIYLDLIMISIKSIISLTIITNLRHQKVTPQPNLQIFNTKTA